MPEIEQENCTRCITLVPHFVLKAVVEDDAATGGPFQLVLGYPHPAVSRLGQAEMAPDACIGRAAMRAQVSPGNHDGEVGLACGTGAWNLRKGRQSLCAAVRVSPD